MKISVGNASDDPRFFQRHESAVFRDGLQRAGGEFHGDEAIQLRNPDPLGPQIRREHPGDDLRHMLSDTAFFLGETATMNDGAFGRACFGNAANFHKFGEWGGDNGGAPEAGQGEIPIQYLASPFSRFSAFSRRMLIFHTAGEEDIPALRTLATRIWRESYSKMISREQMAYMLEWMYSAEAIRSELSEGVLWEIVRLDGEDAGYLSVTFGADGVAKLNKLYILPELQGKGHGQAMLAHVFAEASEREMREMRLQVNKGNVRAQRAYERHGFERVEEAVFDIGGGYIMDDFIMARTVKP